ncbi:SusD/RagB family nutrient-binding outer membrane lipoprotein [Cesiribacter andamanensis]|uniref:Starch-binding associating with outer membrane n=1 Tax=Cesiribacter andamanensis AMV16 TaxID=1279009 RepID=M7N1Q8_9BACT|nr:SusD/RagB family nutrient-binding outer membrane lipoprotein [Cesiribacter andamanensis]EMR01156.1 Starch-binding associating with outer membrane [Cesiribacter andamanensis AMV16]
MNIRPIFTYVLSAGLLFASTSCEDFLDINVDPNNPADVPLAQLLPTTQVTTARSVGLSSRGLSNITSMYMHQLVQRGTEVNDYAFSGTTFGVTAPWNTLYLATLTDLKVMKEKAEAEESFQYLGVAQILEAYIYSVMVDMWGEVPYQEANLGEENTNPTFEDGAAIYADLFTKIDEGIANIKRTSTLSPGEDDVIYGGNMGNWERFANSLKLKMLNQIRLTRDVSNEVNALLSSGMLIQNQAQDFELQYGNTSAPDDRHPGYVEEWAPGGAGWYVSPYFYEIMTGKRTFFASNILEGIQDPRVPYYWYNQVAPDLGESPENATSYYDPATGFLSIYQFSFNIDPNEGFDQGSSQAVAGLYPLGGRYDEGNGLTVNYNGYGSTPQRMLTYFSLLYTRAELALVGASNEDDVDLFRQAMEASFAKVNQVASAAGAPQITQARRDTYINSVMALYEGGATQTRLQLIMTQKWIASFGYAVDAYNDYRRTGFPILHDGNADLLSTTVRGREFPVSFPYPIADLNLLPGRNQRNVYLDRVFWDR